MMSPTPLFFRKGKKMSTSLLIPTMQELVMYGQNFMLTGGTGVGKSSIIKMLAKSLGMDIIISHPALADPTDPKGFPFVVDGKAVFLPFGDLERAMNAKRPTIWFLDDYGQAVPAVQAAYMQLLLEGAVNDLRVSEHVVMVAATNRKEDGCNVSGILECVKSRFITILNVDTNAEDWVVWAWHGHKDPVPVKFVKKTVDRKMPDVLIAFINLILSSHSSIIERNWGLIIESHAFV